MEWIPVKLTYEEKGVIKKVSFHNANIILGFSGIMWVALVGFNQVHLYIASTLPILNDLSWLVCYIFQVNITNLELYQYI